MSSKQSLRNSLLFAQRSIAVCYFGAAVDASNGGPDQSELDDLKERAEGDEMADGGNVEFCGGREDHHSPDRRTQKESELNADHNRVSSISMSVVEGIEVSEDDGLDNNGKHPKRHDGFPAGEGPHGEVFLVEQNHVPGVGNEHRENEIGGDGL